MDAEYLINICDLFNNKNTIPIKIDFICADVNTMMIVYNLFHKLLNLKPSSYTSKIIKYENNKNEICILNSQESCPLGRRSTISFIDDSLPMKDYEFWFANLTSSFFNKTCYFNNEQMKSSDLLKEIERIKNIWS